MVLLDKGGWRRALAATLLAAGLAPVALSSWAAEPSASAASSAVESRTAEQWLAIAEAAMAREPADWQQARTAFEAAATLGSLPAMSYIGWIHEQGHGTPRDLAEAARWYQRVAEGGVDDFAIKLGWLYLQPELGPDRAASERWFRQAIARNSDSARVALASVWVADAQGGDTARLEEAHGLLLEALGNRHPLASRFLARIHVEGIGDYPSTPELRLHYTQLAANDGQPLMQGWLARRYLEGDGVATDPSEAAFWAALAAAGGDPLGRELHSQLQAQLSDDQRRAVMERTVAWSLQHPASH